MGVRGSRGETGETYTTPIAPQIPCQIEHPLAQTLLYVDGVRAGVVLVLDLAMG